MAWLTRALTAVFGVVTLFILWCVMPAPAFASCAWPPRTSQDAFTGTIIALENTGRTATVRVDDGRKVVVRGSDADGSNAATTVDRTYQIGVRYEFHPLNAASPYRDNACTATHEITAVTQSDGPSGFSVATTPLAAKPVRPGSGTTRWLATVGFGLAAIVGVGAACGLRRRQRRAAHGHAPVHTEPGESAPAS